VAANPKSPFAPGVLKCAGAPALSIDQTSIDLAIGVDSAIPQEGPMRSMLVHTRPIYFRRHNLFLLD